MKNGLLVYKSKDVHKNIGDYVQSVAAEQYTGRDAVLVEREHLDKYSGEPVALIMNGWYMHFPENWPPSKDIVPLLTSIHMHPDKGEQMLTPKGIEFFKKYGPVGCRDRGTEKLLLSKGVPAYFSGCLTLTLGKTYKNDPSSDKVCFVDAYYEFSKNPAAIFNYLTVLLSKSRLISKISKKLNGSSSLKKLLRTASFYKAYSQMFQDEVLENADYVTHQIPESMLDNEKLKFEDAKRLLKKYANSKLVVTSRIHAALPCLGMDTPVIFVINDDLQPNGQGLQPSCKGRFDGLLELFNVVENLNGQLKPVLGFEVSQKIGAKHTIRNKQKHKKIAEELDKKCTSFIIGANKKAMEKMI